MYIILWFLIKKTKKQTKMNLTFTYYMLYCNQDMYIGCADKYVQNMYMTGAVHQNHKKGEDKK